MKNPKSLFFLVSLFLFSFFINTLIAQSPTRIRKKPPSPEEIERRIIKLQTELENAQTDTAKVRILILLAGLLSRTDFPKGAKMANETIELAEKTDDKEYLARSYFGAGNMYSRKGKTNEALLHFERGIAVAEQIENPKDLLGNFYILSAQIYQKRGVYEKAITFYHSAIEQFEKYDAPLHRITGPYMMVGNLMNRTENPSKAVYYYEKCIELAEKIGDNRKIVGAYHGLGNSYEFMGDREMAEKAFAKSKEIWESMEKKSTNPPSKNSGNK